MSTFWLLVIAMMLLALVFSAAPLLRRRHDTSIDQNQLNTAVIREQLRELQADLDAGKLDQASWNAAKTDLERELLNQLDDGNEGTAAAPRSGRWAVGLVGLLVPLVAVLLYLQLGAVDFQERRELTAAAQGADADGHPLVAMVAQLSQRMRENPDQLEGWLLLARSYAALNQFDNALEAYAQARRLVGDQPELLIDSADMLVMASGGQFTDEVGALLDQALSVQPDNAKGLWLKGHWKFRNNDIQGAIDNWKKAAAQLPPDSENVLAINQQIRQAQIALGMPQSEAPDAAAPDTGKQQSAGGAIEVTVRLDPALTQQAAPGDTVFIFARAVEGPRMPLAIVRKQVADLPVSVRLDDSLAMTPAMVLSNFDQVAVGARVSRSGNAMAQSGDLEGLTSPVQVARGEAVEVVIDAAVP
ncbi:MAG: c-type cytochrome biogenesis protein CcmI [Thiogranum sp.]|nr:c-type cytochrome biogenesis protein CcmI [Thiogranum sp.]